MIYPGDCHARLKGSLATAESIAFLDLGCTQRFAGSYGNRGDYTPRRKHRNSAQGGVFVFVIARRRFGAAAAAKANVAVSKSHWLVGCRAAKMFRLRKCQ